MRPISHINLQLFFCTRHQNEKDAPLFLRFSRIPMLLIRRRVSAGFSLGWESFSPRNGDDLNFKVGILNTIFRLQVNVCPRRQPRFKLDAGVAPILFPHIIYLKYYHVLAPLTSPLPRSTHAVNVHPIDGRHVGNVRLIAFSASRVKTTPLTLHDES